MDREVLELEQRELARQNGGIELIASENYPSVDVRSAAGSIFTAKYAEGYPHRRYYGGCSVVDELEELAIERCKKLFGVRYANVQPHSGSQANFAAYRALLSPGDKILSLTLNDGGHLTHGSSVSFSANTYSFAFYPLGDDSRLDYDIIRKRLYEEKPNLLLAGFSAYPFEIDFRKMRDLVDEYNQATGSSCAFMVDMAHFAGMVAAKMTMNPCDYADIVTSTTHKTLRGPRGGLILSNREDLARKIDSAVFPYTQGGPLEHIIAAKAVAFKEASAPEFREYYRHVLENTKACNDELHRLGAVVSGTQTHLFLMNVLASFSLNGMEAQELLEKAGITVNKNMLHGDTLPPKLASGVRVGFAAVTSRGCTKDDAEAIGRIIFDVLKGGEAVLPEAKKRVQEIVKRWADVSTLRY